MATDSAEFNQLRDNTVCYQTAMITTSGLWKNELPFDYALPLFLLQTILVVVITRLLDLILKPLRQPRVVAEIIGGIILGPSVLGRFPEFVNVVFPSTSLMTLETVAHVGLILFLFIVGVEMDAMVIRRTGHRALAIAAAGMVIPFVIGTTTSFVFRHFMSRNVTQISFLIFLGVAMSVTAFPVLARILAEIKLLNTELGRLAMSAAVINDMCAWVLLALCIVLTDIDASSLSALWVLLSMVGFILVCFYGVRPAMWWFMSRLPAGQEVSDFHVCCVLTGAILAGLTTDAIGIHAVFGAFVFGLVVPNGQLGVALVEKLEDIVTGIMLPLFFVISGLRTDLSKVKDLRLVGLLVLAFMLASIGKVAGTLILALIYAMPMREGLALGFLMNTRGMLEMIILNIGRDKQVLDDEAFSIMVVISMALTSIVTPAVTYLHRPPRRLIGYKRRNLQRSNPQSELRMLVCVHNTRNVPSILNLLDISNPTKISPIFVYALHLVELSGRASAMLVVHNSSSGRSKPPTALTSTQAQSEHIIKAFESFDQQAGGVSIQTITTVSPYINMHDDICTLAEDKHVALIIIPFHKQQAVDGGMEPINPAIQNLNHNVLKYTPCSVGVLIDRGLNNVARSGPVHLHSYRIVVLFFGGPDDREALAYASRMLEHPGVTLTIVRFIPTDSASPSPSPSPSPRDFREISVLTDSSRDKQLDDMYLDEFRFKNVGNESAVYTEKVVNSTEETVSAIRAMESIHDLYIVGREQDGSEAAAVTAGLMDFAECPELGPIGDLLASSDFSTTVSVLVVQQYVVSGAEEERLSVAATQHRASTVSSRWNVR